MTLLKENQKKPEYSRLCTDVKKNPPARGIYQAKAALNYFSSINGYR